MKKVYLLLASIFVAGLANAQLTGTKNIPGDYATLALAITDLNTVGVGVGGVTLNVLPGNPETAPAGGYVIGGAGSAILVGGAAPTSLANNVQIVGNGNIITASAAHTVGSLTDAIFKLVGADYIGIQGFVMQENPLNTVITPASNNMTEWGVALLYVSTADGSQNNAIASNAISLNRTYNNTWGIYSNTRHSSTLVTTTADIVNNTTGPNSGNRVYANTISNVKMGIAFIGSGTTANQDIGNDIGGTSAITGNTITNWGGAAAASGYISNSGTSYGIFMNHQVGDNVSYNTLTSAALSGTAVTTRGIFKDYTTTGATLVGTTTISNNTVTFTDNFTSGTLEHIRTQGTVASGSTLNINNNTILNSTVGGAASSTTMVCIVNSSAAGTLNINNNIIRGLTSTATSGGFTGISNTGAVVTTLNINNNEIGNASGGAITFSAATSGTVTGISSSGGASTCSTTIQGNDIRGIVHAVAGSSTHNYIASTGSPLNNTIANNTFTNLNVNTTGSATFFAHSYSMPANGTQTINNNSIVTAYNKGGAGGTVTISTTNGSSPNGSSNTVTNNNFSNITVTGATGITGINNTDGSGSSPSKNCSNNTFNNWTGGTSTILMINYGYIGATVSNISNNTLTNINGQAAVTAIQVGSSFNGGNPLNIASNTLFNIRSTGTGGAVTGITCSNTSAIVNINNNSISGMSSTAGAAVSGLVVSGATNTSVFKNSICDLAGSNASSTVNGILVSAGTLVNVYNNLIGDLRTPVANAANPLVGLNITGGTTVNAHFNTVRIAGTSAGALFGSSAVSVSTTPTVTLRNNIFVNLGTTNGAAFTAAYRRSTATLTSYAAASNNNLFYAGTPGATNVIYYDGTNSDQTLIDYKARVSARDNMAVTENPPFLSTTCGNANFLHIDPSIATQVESGGVAIAGVTDDFDGNTRNVSTPDIGGDEGNFIVADVTPPAITYTPLTYICTTGDRSLTATISDFSGIPTSGILQPRVYFRKNAGAWFSTQGTLSSGTGTNGTWTFNIVTATMGGLVANDIVQYYVIAQDIVTPTPNVGSSPAAGLVATDVNTVTTAPTTPSSYNIGGFLSGTYTVGVTGTYPTLTAAVNAYNTNCIGGPIIFELIDATYSGSETFPIVINQNAAASAVNTLTIRPAAATTSDITGSANSALIKVLGNYVTIDGSNNGTNTRDLTISNTSITTPNVIWFGSVGTTPIINSGVKNSILINGANTSSAIVISDGVVAGTAGYFNNITIQNNNVQRAFIGIFGITVVAPGNGSGTLITQNDLNTAGANSIRLVGIYAQGLDGVTISNNNIGNIVNTTDAANLNGIFIATGTVNVNIVDNTINTISGSLVNPVGIRLVNGVAATNGNVTGNTVSAITSTFGGAGPCSGIQVGATATGGYTIARNNVFNVKNTNAGGWGANGIQLSSSLAAANISVVNNFVSDVAANGFNGQSMDDNGYGIVLSAGGGYNVYYNTVLMNTDQVAGTGLPAAINIGSGVSTPASVDLRNNIFANIQTVGTDRYAITCGATNAVFSSINYNNYTAGGTNLGFIGSNRANLTAIQTGFGGNGNSLNVAPVFVGAPDLHLIPASNGGLNDFGVSIPAVTVDIDNAPRSLTPDMGADEFVPALCVGTPTAGTATLSQPTVCANLPTTLTLSGYSVASGLAFQWQASILPGGPYSAIPGATSPIFTGVVPFAGTAFITCLVTCTNGGATALSNEVTLTVNPVPVVTVSPTTGSICNPAGSPINLTASSTGGTGAVAFTWSPTTGLTPSTGSPVSALPTATTSYVVTGTDAAGCLSTATAVISVGNNITGLTATATPSTICAGDNSQLLATGSLVGLANEYTFASSTGATLDPMTGSTTVLSPNNDDAPTAAPVAIGFPFVYEGVTYTQYSVSPDGWILLGPTVAVSQFSNAMTSATNAPKLAAYWDDLATGTDGNVKTLVTGTAPNRIFKVQWFITSPRNTTGPANGTFQAWLYENDGRIEYRYGTLAASGSASGGLTGATSTNIHSLTFGSNTSSPSVANDLNAAAPASGTMYTYTPPSIAWAWSPATFIAGQTSLANPLATAVTAPITYTVVGTTNAGCTATTTVAVAVNPTVTPSVSITAAPGAVICAGTSVTFTAVPTNGGTTPAYQWSKNGSPVGTNSDTYTDAALANGDLITCVLTSNATCASPTTATSNTITMTVNPVLVPSVSITAAPGAVICAGTSVTFTAVPTNGGSTPAYQWKKNGSNVGTNSDTYTDPALANGDLITCDLTSNAVCAAPTSTTSNTITMTVNPLLTPAVTITANPGVSICAGTNVDFTAVPTNGGTTPAYQWLKNGSNVGTNSATYSDNGLVNGDVITCVLTSNAVCATPLTATSNSLAISVVTNTTPTASITVNPGSTICPGGSATFTAVAANAGTTPSYQWTLNGGNVGTNSTTYTNGALATGDIVICVVTSSDPCALPTTATSNSIAMTVADLTDPIAVCQSVTVALNGGGTGTTTATAVNNGSNDNCTSVGLLGLALSNTSFTCANLGANTVTLTVTDAAARTGTCSATVTVVDNIQPAITCPANIAVGTGVACNATVSYTTPSGTDNCTPTTTRTAGLASGSSFPLGSTTNTYSVTDASGNTATCSFTVTVSDATAPVAACQAVTVSLDGGGSASTTATAVNNLSSDNCTLSGSLGLALNTTGFTCANLGSNTVILTVTDAASNTSTCSATVTVVDNILPAITCPGNLTGTNSPGLCTGVVTYGTPAGTDNCTPTTTQTAGLASGANFPVGVTTNTFRVTDGSANSATCAFTVTITDTEAPAVTCPANVTTTNDLAQCSAVVTYVVPAGTDNCPSTTTTQTAGLPSTSAFPVGTTNNVYQVTDAAGNTATCTFSVIVNDAEAPTWSGCPATLSVSTSATTCDAAVSWTVPTSADNCTGSSTSSSNNPGDVFAVGTTTVTYTSTDAAGNTATCTFDVTVADSVAPTATCQAVTVTLDANGDASTTPAAIDNGSSDACGSVTLALDQSTFTCADAGATTVTLTVTDGSGNSSTCTTTVTVLTQPVTSAATATVVDCGFNVSCNGATDGTATAVGGGGCGPYTYLWTGGQTTATVTGLGAGTTSVTVTDAAGGTSVATVTLTEPSALVATAGATTNSCPGDSTGSADMSATGGNACLPYTYVWSNAATTQNLSNVGAGIYTVTVTDVNGCSATQTVTVGAFAAPVPTFTVVSPVLVAGQVWVSYQWQLNGIDIPGATAATYTAVTSGDYTLVVTDTNGCTGTSTVSSVIVVATVDPAEGLVGLALYPNPARGEFKLLTDTPITQGLSVSITDMYGQRIAEKAMASLGHDVAFDITGYSAGSYLVEVVSKGGQRKVFRLVVQ